MPFANRSIANLYRLTQRFFALELRRANTGLEVGWLPVLMQTYHTPGVTQDGISAAAGMDKGTVARVLKQLEDAGFVTRTPDEADRRVNHVFPTQKALDARPHVQEVIQRLHEILCEGLSEEEMERTFALLERMRGNLTSHLEVRRG